MMQAVATIACAAFIVYLFWTSERHAEAPSKALWIPVIWMFLAGSRWLSAWLGMAPTLESASDYAEGSPIDRMAFLALLVVGAIVLGQRKIAWGRLFADNKWIVLYLLYALASVLWSDEPYISLRRWVKDLGNPIMALVILTDR